MKLIVLCLVTTLFSGCAVYRPQPLVPGRTAAAFEARTLDSPDLRKFMETNLHHEVAPWPPQSWDFPMLTLVAFYYHPDLDVARAGWDKAKAGKITAGQLPNPTAGFTPQYDTTPQGNISPWTLGFNLDIPVETAGKRGYRIARAESLSRVARLNIATTAWQVRSRLEAVMLDLYTAGNTASLLQREENSQEELTQLLERRLTAGEVSLPEVTLVRLALAQTRLLWMETERRFAESRASLASALGLPLAAIGRVNLSLDGIEESSLLPPAPDLRRQALTGRSDLLALLAEYDAAEAALRLEIAKQYPDIHLGPGYQWDQGENKWYLGFSVTLPLFNHNQGPVAEAEARRTEAGARFLQLQSRIIGEVDRALAGYLALRAKLAEADALLAEQKSRQLSVAALFKAGESDRLALVGSAVDTERATLARLETLSGLLQARRALEDALQRPLAAAEQLPIDVETNPRPEKEHVK